MVPNHSSLLAKTAQEDVEKASDASKTSPMICLSLTLLTLATSNLLFSASQEETRKRRDEWKLARDGNFNQD